MNDTSAPIIIMIYNSIQNNCAASQTQISQIPQSNISEVTAFEIKVHHTWAPAEIFVVGSKLKNTTPPPPTKKKRPLI